MSDTTNPKLVFPSDFDERTAFEVEREGCFDRGIAELPDGRQVNVCFYDPHRLAQDLESGQELGRVAVAEAGLIVIPRVTVQNMRRAVTELYDSGYFGDLSSVIL